MLIVISIKNVHAIGDRANKIVLDIFEGIETTDSGAILRRRPRIEHAQIMSLGDLDRMGRLGGQFFHLSCVKKGHNAFFR
jgi:predicted amidohydrolase YtcJ